jgi:hypothetical protein
MLLAVTFPLTVRLAIAPEPLTVRLLSVPTLVILGWAAVVTVAAVLLKALTLAKLASSSLSGMLPVLLAKV